jgi:phage-related protein
MAKTRKNRKNGSGIVSRVWSPFGHLFSASGESVKKVGNTAGSVVKQSINTFKNVGNTFARHTNMAIRGITSRKGRKSRKGRNSRKGRKSRK